MQTIRSSTPSLHRRGLAIGLSVMMPGLGHLWAGWVHRGLLIWGGTVCLLGGTLWWWVRLPHAVRSEWGAGCALWGVIAWAVIRDLLRLYRQPYAPQRPPFTGVGGYLALAAAMAVAPLGLTVSWVQRRVLGVLTVSNTAMFPQLLPGDEVRYLRNTFAHTAPHPGDLVVVNWSNGERGIARVVAGPGQVISVRNGHPIVDGQALRWLPVQGMVVSRFSRRAQAKLRALEGYREFIGSYH